MDRPVIWPFSSDMGAPSAVRCCNQHRMFGAMQGHFKIPLHGSRGSLARMGYLFRSASEKDVRPICLSVWHAMRTCSSGRRIRMAGMSQSRAVLSSDPVRMRRPSGEKATDQTAPSCPEKTFRAFPVSASQSRAVWSSDPVRMRRPSGEKATD